MAVALSHYIWEQIVAQKMLTDIDELHKSYFREIEKEGRWMWLRVNRMSA